MQGDLWSARAREWSELQEGSFRPLYDAAFGAAKVGKATLILDVGCGAGLACLVAQSLGAKVSGLDAAAGLAAIARGRCPGADIRVGEIEELPFGDDSFDVTTGFNSFQYAADSAHALAEANRVTKPNGFVVVAVWGAPDKYELAPYLGAVGKLLPPPPPGAPGPFALSAPGTLEALAGKAFPATGDGILFFPTGLPGPAFIVTPNFDVIKDYNESAVYALAIGHLSDLMQGGVPFKTPWPAQATQLPRDDRIALQKKLAALGYDQTRFSAHIDFKMRDFVRAEQKKHGLVTDGHPNAALMDKMGVKRQP